MEFNKKYIRFSNKTFSLIAISLMLVGILALIIQKPSLAQVSPIDPNYSLVWQDEFDGSSLDTNSWDYQSGEWASSGVQNCYKYGDNNVSVNNGSLKITAKYEPGTICNKNPHDFTSGFIQTKGKRLDIRLF